MHTASENLGNVPAFISRALVAALMALFLAGCGDSKIQVYTIPKEDAWKLPAGWVERTAGGMRAARFAATSTNGSELDISIIPIRGFGGSQTDVINIWRQQMQLEPLSDEAEAKKLAQSVKMGSNEGELYDLTSASTMLEGKKARTMVGVLRKDGTAWFVKMTGDEQGVEGQKTAFLQFLKDINFNNIVPPSQAEMASASGEGREGHGPDDGHNHGEAGAHPDWQVPSGWVEQTPTASLNAKFMVPGENGTKADINVAVFQGDGGGLRMNMDRWRQQIGLKPWEDGEAEKHVTTIDAVSGKAMLVDFKGMDPRTRRSVRLIGAIVPVGGQTWFYKMLGDETVVERERQSFVKFVSSAKHPNG